MQFITKNPFSEGYDAERGRQKTERLERQAIDDRKAQHTLDSASRDAARDAFRDGGKLADHPMAGVALAAAGVRGGGQMAINTLRSASEAAARDKREEGVYQRNRTDRATDRAEDRGFRLDDRAANYARQDVVFNRTQAAAGLREVKRAREANMKAGLKYYADGNAKFGAYYFRLAGVEPPAELAGNRNFARLLDQGNKQARAFLPDGPKSDTYALTFAQTGGNHELALKAANAATTVGGKAATAGAPKGSMWVDPSDPSKGVLPIPRAEGAPPAPLEAADIKNESAMRKEFSQATKEFAQIDSAMRRVMSSQPTAVGDIAMIFAYMKMLDPGSVVREGEFATAETAQGVPDRIRNIYNKALTGQRLPDTVRASMRAQAQALYKPVLARFNEQRERYSRIADQYKFAPGRVVYDAMPLPEQQVAPTPGVQLPASESVPAVPAQGPMSTPAPGFTGAVSAQSEATAVLANGQPAPDGTTVQLNGKAYKSFNGHWQEVK